MRLQCLPGYHDDGVMRCPCMPRQWVTTLPMALVIAVVSGFSFGFASDASARQSQSVEIPNTSSCTGCTVVTRIVTPIGSRNGDGSLSSEPFDVRLDSRKRYWVMPRTASPMIYDSAGKFLRYVGARGRGPGEFVGPAAVMFMSGDSLLVLDFGQRRGSVLNGALEVVRTFSIANMVSAVELVGRTVLASGSVPTPASADLPLHFMPIEGNESRIVKSFEPNRVETIAPRSNTLDWNLAIGTNKTFWTADFDRYRLINWSSSGTPLRVLTRTPEWFRTVSPIFGDGPSRPPHPTMHRLFQDTDGLIWVSAHVAAPTWRDAYTNAFRGVQSSSKGMADVPSQQIDELKLRSLKIDIVDPLAARLVTSFEVSNRKLIAWLPSRRAALYYEDVDGYPHLDIVQFDVVRR